MSEKLKLKPIVPCGAPAFQESLEELKDKLPKTISSPTDGTILPLKENRLDWDINGRKYYLGPIPVYEDPSTKKTYIKKEILDRAKDCIMSSFYNPENAGVEFNLPEGISRLN